VVSSRGQTPPRAEPRQVTPRPALGESERAVVELFQNAAPSVAYITTEVPVQGGWFGGGVARGAGSGFIWDTAGHVVTNNHVAPPMLSAGLPNTTLPSSA
jgi:2-alkenal reductase